MELDTLTIGSKIRCERKKAGLTQVQLAERMRVSQQAVGQLEKSKNLWVGTLLKVSDALGVSYTKFLEVNPQVQQESLSDYSTLELIQELERRERERL